MDGGLCWNLILKIIFNSPSPNARSDAFGGGWLIRCGIFGLYSFFLLSFNDDLAERKRSIASQHHEWWWSSFYEKPPATRCHAMPTTIGWQTTFIHSILGWRRHRRWITETFLENLSYKNKIKDDNEISDDDDGDRTAPHDELTGQRKCGRVIVIFVFFIFSRTLYYE